MTDATPHATDRLQTKGDPSRSTWSRAYWAIVIHQIVIVGLVGLLSVAMLGESYRACEAASVELPAISLWYFFSVGPAGLVLAGLASIAVSLAVVGLRRRLAAAVIASASFVACILFFIGALFSSIAPLLVVVRESLPPDQRW